MQSKHIDKSTANYGLRSFWRWLDLIQSVMPWQLDNMPWVRRQVLIFTSMTYDS